MEKIIKKINIDKCLMILAIAIFCLLTIPKLLHHFPWFDESHAWMLAKQMNIHNFIAIMKSEGHFIIWYILLMPFAKLNLWYPNSLKFLNWILYFLAILIMWRKAPFNSVLKTIITLSWTSLNYFPIVARCYSIGILGLFLLAALYNEKTKKPVLYSLIIVMTAHTSLLATFAIIPIGLIFLYEMIEIWKNGKKKEAVISALILIVGGILWIYPYLNGYGNKALLSENPGTLKHLFSIFKAYKYTIGISYTICSLIILFYTDNKIRLFFALSIAQFILFFTFIYSGYPQHVVFLYIYLIIALWLTPKLHKWDIKTSVFIIIFAILSNLNMNYGFAHIINNPNKNKLIKYLNEQKPKYLIIPWSYDDMSPLLSEDIKVTTIYDLNGMQKEHSNNFEEYIIENYIKNDNDYDMIIISNKKINDNSEPFKIKNKRNKNTTIYLTKTEIRKE